MDKRQFFIGFGLLLFGCGSPSAPPSDSGSRDHDEIDASADGQHGSDAQADTAEEDAPVANDAPADAVASEGGSVPCGSDTCGAGEYCIEPSCGGADTGTACKAPGPYCAQLPKACDAPSASCSCLGSKQFAICEGDTGSGGQCSLIDHKTRVVRCASA